MSHQDDELEALLDRIPVLQGLPRTVVELPGGLTNRNLHVTTAERRLRGAGVPGATPSCSASTATPSTTTPGRPPRRGSAPGSSTTCRTSACWSSTTSTAPRCENDVVRAIPTCSSGRPRPAGSCTRARGSPATSTCSAGRRRTCATVQEHGYRLFDGYADHDDAFHRVQEALAVRAAPTVPCNNDLLAGNFVDDGDKMWLIDYEYSGNNDACFELGNTAPSATSTTTRSRRWRRRTSAAWSGTCWRGCGCRRWSRQYGWSLWGAIQAAASSLDFDFYGWGQERFDKADRDLPRAGVRAAAGGCDACRLSCRPAPGSWSIGGGVIGTSVAYHLTRLGLDRRAAAGAGRLSGGTTWHAAGLVGPLRASESGTRLVQYSAELYARLEEETGLATGYKQRRRRDRGAHRGPDGAAAAHRGQRDGVRHGVRAADARRGARAVAGDGGRRPARRDLAARRRQGQPDRPDHGAGQGRPRRRRPDRRAGAGARRRRRGRAGRTPGHRRCARTGATSRPRWSSTAPASGRRRSRTRSA